MTHRWTERVQCYHYRLSAGISVAGVLVLNLSRRDKNRADLSLDK